MLLCGICGDEALDDGWLNGLRNSLCAARIHIICQVSFNYLSNTVLTADMNFREKLICTPAEGDTFKTTPTGMRLFFGRLATRTGRCSRSHLKNKSDLCVLCCCAVCPNSCIYLFFPASFTRLSLTPPLMLSAHIQRGSNWVFGQPAPAQTLHER